MGLTWIRRRFEIVWEKGLDIMSFYPFRPFALKFFAVGPHMALSRYQKEGRCVR